MVHSTPLSAAHHTEIFEEALLHFCSLISYYMSNFSYIHWLFRVICLVMACPLILTIMPWHTMFFTDENHSAAITHATCPQNPGLCALGGKGTLWKWLCLRFNVLGMARWGCPDLITPVLLGGKAMWPLQTAVTAKKQAEFWGGRDKEWARS